MCRSGGDEADSMVVAKTTATAAIKAAARAALEGKPEYDAPVSLTLPPPPSTNNLYFNASHGGRVLTTKGKHYKQDVADLCLAAGITNAIFHGEVSVTIHWYRPRAVGDLDGCLKIVLDSLTGIVWIDDKQVSIIRATRHEDKEHPRAEIKVERLDVS
jgi:Holliday junction resolvase RusA-like endonuclease